MTTLGGAHHDHPIFRFHSLRTFPMVVEQLHVQPDQSSNHSDRSDAWVLPDIYRHGLHCVICGGRWVNPSAIHVSQAMDDTLPDNKYGRSWPPKEQHGFRRFAIRRVAVMPRTSKIDLIPNVVPDSQRRLSSVLITGE
jgi:hypothetical protein